MKLSNIVHLTVFAVLLLIQWPSVVFADDSQQRIDAELANKAEAIVPLKSVLGEKKFNEAMASRKYMYMGNLKCRLCHKEFFVGRKQDAHDHAFEELVEKGYSKNPKCLGCHTTGFGVSRGFVSIETTPRLANVQCEGCHGPGNQHMMRDKKGGLLVGTDKPRLLKKMCKTCHTERWNRSFEKLHDVFDKYKKPKPQ
ncbi:MAG: hypothetical protein IME93_07675 [Proteobacteria bacterium]|nr:hypothetical protein [Pseudomonadota bacterium]